MYLIAYPRALIPILDLLLTFDVKEYIGHIGFVNFFGKCVGRASSEDIEKVYRRSGSLSLSL